MQPLLVVILALFAHNILALPVHEEDHETGEGEGENATDVANMADTAMKSMQGMAEKVMEQPAAMAEQAKETAQSAMDNAGQTVATGMTTAAETAKSMVSAATLILPK